MQAYPGGLTATILQSAHWVPARLRISALSSFETVLVPGCARDPPPASSAGVTAVSPRCDAGVVPMWIAAHGNLTGVSPGSHRGVAGAGLGLAAAASWSAAGLCRCPIRRGRCPKAPEHWRRPKASPLGRLALARHQQLRPHALPSFSQLARLLQIGFGFGRLACGPDPRQPAPPALPNSRDFKEAEPALARSYGRSFMRDTGCCQ